MSGLPAAHPTLRLPRPRHLTRQTAALLKLPGELIHRVVPGGGIRTLIVLSVNVIQALE